MWFIVLRGKHKLQAAYKDKLLRKIFETQKDEGSENSGIL
jgi:hypothetical protein